MRERINMKVKIPDGTMMAEECFKINSSAKGLYFHGHDLEKFLGNEAFSKLQDSMGVGLCHELSVLAMLCLKHNDTAQLCTGDYVSEDGLIKTKHSFVKFDVEANGIYVMDFGWCGKGFICDIDSYFNFPGELIEKNSVSYEEFWKTPFFKDLYEAMKERRYSYVLEDLSRYCIPDENYNLRCYKYKSGDFQIGFPLRTQLPISVINELYSS